MIFSVSNEMKILIILSFGLFLGKHTCLGTRLAKVELKLIVSMFLLGFDLGIVDKHGKPKADLPKPNWNDILLCRPPKGSFYMGFKRKEGVSL